MALFGSEHLCPKCGAAFHCDTNSCALDPIPCGKCQPFITRHSLYFANQLAAGEPGAVLAQEKIDRINAKYGYQVANVGPRAGVAR